MIAVLNFDCGLTGVNRQEEKYFEPTNWFLRTLRKAFRLESRGGGREGSIEQWTNGVANTAPISLIGNQQLSVFVHRDSYEHENFSLCRNKRLLGCEDKRGKNGARGSISPTVARIEPQPSIIPFTLKTSITNRVKQHGCTLSTIDHSPS